MADVNVQDVDLSGATPTYSAADAAGDRFKPRTTRSVLLHVKNDDTSSHTVTLVDSRTNEPANASAFDPNVDIAVPAGEERMVPVNDRFIDEEGWVNLQWSSATGMTFGAFRAL